MNTARASRPSLRRTLLCVALAAALFSVSGLAACNKEDKQAKKEHAGEAAEKSAATGGAVTLTKTIATMIPEQAVGFFVWQGKHPAYENLQRSPWGSEGELSKMLQDSNPQIKEARDLLQNIGIDLNDKNVLKNFFNEAAVFVTPGAEAGKPGAIGVVFKSDPSIKLSEKLAGLKTELGKKDFNIQDVKLANGTGYSLVQKADGASGEKMFVGYKENIGVFGSSDWVVDSVLGSKGTTLPAIVSSPNFARAAKGLPDDSIRFATAYVDFQKMAEVSDRLGGAGGADSVKQMTSTDLPLKAVSVSMAMDKTPQTNLRLIYDPAQRSKGWLGALNASSSGEMLSVVPSKPLVFLSLDGKTLRQVKEIALAGMGEAGKAYESQLTLLNDVKRIGVSARASAPGASLLPIPDILVVVESSNPAQTLSQLQTLSAGWMQATGLPPTPWNEKKVGDVNVKSLVTPFGMGVFLAANKNLVLVSSSDPQMASALGATAGFSTEIPAQVEQVFAKEQSLGNIYLNFEEIASLMENMGGMLSMYAPQEPGKENQFMQAENIQAMKKMGTVVGSVTIEEDAIGIRSFYQQPRPTA